MNSNFYEKQFDSAFDRNDNTECTKILIIASTGRSGSHMLGHLMQQSGGLGVPFEYFNQANMTRWMKSWKVDSIDGYVSVLKRKRVDDNGVLSLTLHYHQLLDLGGYSFIKKHFPNAKVIHVYRENQIMQAVSFSKAIQDGVWIGGQETQGTACYKYRLIYNSLRLIEESCLGWRMLAVEEDFPLLEVSMESIIRNPAICLRSIYSYIDEVVPVHVDQVGFSTKKQGGGSNREWAKRFCREYGIRSKRLHSRVLCKLLSFV